MVSTEPGAAHKRTSAHPSENSTDARSVATGRPDTGLKGTLTGGTTQRLSFRGGVRHVLLSHYPLRTQPIPPGLSRCLPRRGSHVAENSGEIEGIELEVLRAGIRLMALRAFGNADLADEVAQESIVRAFHSLRSSRPEKLGPFVAGIARHIIADIIRVRPREVPLDGLAPDSEPQTHSDPLTILCDASEQARVHRALGLLAREDRDLLHLVFFEGLSPSEIAQRLGVPPERIRQRKLRALGRLRVAFDAATETARPRHAGRPGATIKSAFAGAPKPSRSTE